MYASNASVSYCIVLWCITQAPSIIGGQKPAFPNHGKYWGGNKLLGSMFGFQNNLVQLT